MISNISTLYSENYKSTEMKNKKNTEDVDKRADEKKEIKQVHQESVQEVVVEKENIDQEEKKHQVSSTGK